VTSPRSARRWADPRAIGLIVGVVAIVVVAVTALSAPRTTPTSTAASPSPALSAGSPSAVATAAAATPLATPAASVLPPAATAGIVAVRIKIPTLGIDLPIVEGDGMEAPMNEAAHFPGTAWPGAGSNTYIYAHAQQGMFLRLWDAKVGDEVRLTLKTAESRCYRVSQVVPRVAWNDTSYLLPTDSERLTLQTSTSYTPTAPRFVVLALPCR
jgi:sortase A